MRSHFCARGAAPRPEIAFGADLIAGFPTETEEMFANTLSLVDECGLTFLHVFPFSPRNGTPAARMPQVPRPVVKERAARLRAAGEAALAGHLDRQVGARRAPSSARDSSAHPAFRARPQCSRHTWELGEGVGSGGGG